MRLVSMVRANRDSAYTHCPERTSRTQAPELGQTPDVGMLRRGDGVAHSEVGDRASSRTVDSSGAWLAILVTMWRRDGTVCES